MRATNTRNEYNTEAVLALSCQAYFRVHRKWFWMKSIHDMKVERSCGNRCLQSIGVQYFVW